jgi:hypothetical protein
VLLAKNPAVLDKDAITAAKEEPRAKQRPPLAWMDDYVSLFKVLK